MLIITAQNKEDHYEYKVFVNRDLIAKGTTNHNREDGWRDLLQAISKAENTLRLTNSYDSMEERYYNLIKEMINEEGIPD